MTYWRGACTSVFVGSITDALTTAPWNSYLSSVLGMLGPFLSPIVTGDIDKIFSLTMSLGAITRYTRNVPRSLPIYHSPVYVVSAALFAVNISLVVIVGMQIRK